MAREVELKCHTCGFKWTEDIDDHQAEKVIYRRAAKATRVEVYRFKCQRDGTYVVAEVEIEE